ncbi:mandelate racemase/muconate lactonizing enzyme family protein [Conexibacter arvalis]|uniref:L-alanine-DL-glutamate epimerase-like enolase superfamily enzyme n=1 Tax=Conexibacter arvalis TaxID=912552 RepID=A0A840I899_9ACTN|nr:mandelate racemase/muconate lactonizing enzyme family protein [Conexibacter arvalis]MBB4660501.1 L-alanine-DL-glutamate epimerase-like enolase superfamily enzyme [Conexibacter arvalis]
MSAPEHVVARVEAFPLVYAEPHYRGAERCVTLVRIETDTGAVGWGEAISQLPPATLATRLLVEQAFAPLVIGGDATEVEAHWHAMCRHAYWFGVEGIAAFAISAIDMALWDLKGKLLGQPVASLLGGRLRRELPAMGSIIFDMDDLDWTLAEFQSMRDQGYRIVKAGWGMTLDSVFGTDRARDLRYLTEVRGVIGDELSLVVDVPGAQRVWDLQTAQRRLREWEQFDLRWVEQPLHPAELELHRRLRAATVTPVGTGEDEWGPESYRHVIASGGVDVLQLDPGRCLGLTGCREVVRQVEAAGIRYSMHSWSGALNTAASLHVLALSEHGDTLDFKPHPSPMQHDVVADPWVQRDGLLALRDAPGLGVEIEEAALGRFALGRRRYRLISSGACQTC